MNLFEVATAWASAGFSVVPARQDGSKAPVGDWKKYQNEAPSLREIKSWYDRPSSRTGIGLICGKISGNLEMLELEGRATDGDSLDKIWDACVALGCQDVWTMLCDGYMERTPSGGIHFLYRIKGEDEAGLKVSVPGNTKIARRPATAEELAQSPLDKIKTLSETRGEGGYVVIAPSHGPVHPSGESWDMISGQPGTVVDLHWEDRCRLHEAIHVALDEMPVQEIHEPRPPRPTIPGETRPGDDFNSKISWSELLVPRGWTLVYQRGDKLHWCRPGKNQGISATTSETTGRLWVFSSSTEFEPEKHYSKFEAYTLWEHGGNYSAAAAELARNGLGSGRHTYASGVLASPFPPQIGQQDVELPVPVSPGTPAAVAFESPTSVIERAGIPTYSPQVFKYMRKWDGITLADAWTGLNKGVFRYVGSDKTWMHFDGVIWNRAEKGRERLAAQYMVAQMLEHADTVTDEDVKKGIKRELKRYTTSNGVSSIISNSNCRPEVACGWEEFDSRRHLLTLNNGTLNLNTLELEPHSHENMLTRKINASFDPHAKEGRFTRFMEEVLPDQQVREYLQRICGYALSGEADNRVLVQLYGPSGSGKSQFMKALFNVMGDFAKRSSDSAFQARPNSYKGPSEDLHSLMGSRFAMMPELDEGFRLNVSLIKALTGGDSLTTRRLYGQESTWRPEFTVFMITNHLPRVAAGEDAYWNRVKPIKFGQVFVDSMGDVANPEDRNLGEKMAAEEPEVILNWILEGLKQYRERGLDTPEQINQWRDDYRDDVDTVRQFLNEAPGDGRIAVEESAAIGVRQLHLAYTAWCGDNQVPPLGMRKFNERMVSAGFEKHKKESGIMWQGIRLDGMIGEATTPGRRGFQNGWAYQRE